MRPLFLHHPAPSPQGFHQRRRGPRPRPAATERGRPGKRTPSPVGGGLESGGALRRGGSLPSDGDKDSSPSVSAPGRPQGPSRLWARPREAVVTVTSAPESYCSSPWLQPLGSHHCPMGSCPEHPLLLPLLAPTRPPDDREDCAVPSRKACGCSLKPPPAPSGTEWPTAELALGRKQ